MSDAAYYRGEALRFLQFARTAHDRATARRWRRLADEYVILAAQLDAQDTGRTPFLRAAEARPQPQLQLQRSKAG